MYERKRKAARDENESGHLWFIPRVRNRSCERARDKAFDAAAYWLGSNRRNPLSRCELCLHFDIDFVLTSVLTSSHHKALRDLTLSRHAQLGDSSIPALIGDRKLCTYLKYLHIGILQLPAPCDSPLAGLRKRLASFSTGNHSIMIETGNAEITKHEFS